MSVQVQSPGDEEVVAKGGSEDSVSQGVSGFTTPVGTKTSRTVPGSPRKEGVTISPSAFGQNPFAPFDPTSQPASERTPASRSRFGVNQAGIFSTKAKEKQRKISFGSVEQEPDFGTVYTMMKGLEDSRKEREKKKEKLTYSTLREVRGPFSKASMEERCYFDGNVNFIACKSIPDLLKFVGYGGKLINHTKEAAELGSKFVGRKVNFPTPDNPALTRTDERSTFKATLDILDELLTIVVKYDDGSVEGYGLEDQIYQSLQSELVKIKQEVEEELAFAGRELNIPIWGKDGDTKTLWSDNDFEIIGAVYRLEVEEFLAKILEFAEEDGQKAKAESKGASEARDEEARIANARKIPIQAFSKQSDFMSRNEQYAAPPSSISQAFRQNPLGRTRAWNDPARLTPSFGHPGDNTSGKRVREMFEDTANQQPTETMRARGSSRQISKQVPNGEDRRSSEKGKARDAKQVRHAGQPDGGPPDDGDDDGDKDNKRNSDKFPREPSGPRGGRLAETRDISNSEPRFDNRLKVDTIPTWDGDIDTLGRWILKLNRLSERSNTIYNQLGFLVPSRLTSSAETWYYSQSVQTHTRIEENWGSLRDAIGAYYMNRSYMDRQKARANRASYRDTENAKETPSEYFIRKLELIDLVYDYNDMEIINEIMSGAPSYWASILTPHLYYKLDDFQLAIKFHEENLIRLDYGRQQTFQGYNNTRDRDLPSRNPFNAYRNAKTNLVGWSKNTTNPPFPKDDTTISPRGTPEDKGARPCRHCGSGKHWDPDCKYARKGEKRARVNMVSTSEEDQKAQEEYDTLFFEEVSDDERDDQDF